LAEGARTRGWAVAMPSYDLCPRVRISDITRQVAQAIAVAAAEVPGPIRLTGHSAGGHLVARMGAVLAPELLARVAHVLPISPLSDLRPLMRTSMNADLKIDDAEARAESPIYAPPPPMPVTVWVGGDERPAFLDQARKLSQVWDCGLVIDEGRHHFDVIDALADPESGMVVRLLDL
ncbi:MAG: alpha/beta hydrolase fold domain-containing protein, partial [Mameliella sp.]|nr:alpha/beta hydrolase fold domain-containing protein [Mameliella sp.]